MIRGYYEIAFVYGQSTYGIANKVKEYIETKYADYPIKIKLCDDSSFRAAKGSVGIDDVVENEFERAKSAIIFVGKDMLTYSFPIDNFQPPKNAHSLSEIVKDELFGNKSQITPTEFMEWVNQKLKFTLSQNAVFEMGHLWTKLSFDNIRLVTAFPISDNSFKMPSDIPTQYLFYCKDNYFDEFINNQITNKVLPIANVLNDETYQVDYKDLFTNEELEIIDSPRKSIEQQFEKINELWTYQVMSLQKDYERLIFIYERLVFLSYLPYSGGYDRWLTSAMQEVEDKNALFYKILIQIKAYINAGQQRGRTIGNKFEIYKNIANTLYDIRTDLEKQKITINPLIEIYLNDYLGLACRIAVLEFRKLENVITFKESEYLERSIDALKRCSDIETTLSSEASLLWSGYSIYNIARTYQVLGNQNDALNHMANACDIREKWLTLSSLGKMPRVFEHSFKAEFVITAMNAITMGCFEDNEKNRVKIKCEETLETLKVIKIKSVAIVEDTIRKFESSLIRI
ncbi:MAG: hypothetical protein LBN27_12950 [Prevotellaceae bacterium]|jgi:tetratricopeptide (TPR) repeat protein|nr:hypothetical protein [Prevotellaceae bacterium]